MRVLWPIALLWVVATAASAQPKQGDFARYQRWKPIDAAIAIDPLDGPTEIQEKADIVADRHDALKAEWSRVSGECAALGMALASVRQQADALRDLASVRNRRDVLLRQRQQALYGRQRDLEMQASACTGARAGLEAAVAAEAVRHQDYLKAVQRVRAEESQQP